MAYRDRDRLVEVLRSLNPQVIDEVDVRLLNHAANRIAGNAPTPDAMRSRLRYMSIAHRSLHVRDLARNALHVLQTQYHLRTTKRGSAHGA